MRLFGSHAPTRGGAGSEHILLERTVALSKDVGNCKGQRQRHRSHARQGNSSATGMEGIGNCVGGMAQNVPNVPSDARF